MGRDADLSARSGRRDVVRISHQLEMSPFGYVAERPRCPYCGRALGWWAAPNLEHTDGCFHNPKNVEQRHAVLVAFQRSAAIGDEQP